MESLISHLTDAPISNLLIIAGLIFLGIGVVGEISGKIKPDRSGRIMSGVLGLALVVGGVYMHSSSDVQNGKTAPTPQTELPSPKTLPTTPAQPTPPPSPSASPTPQGFRVVEAFLRADPFDYRGPCPAKITFAGRISVVGGGGRVSYKFLRNDGASAPVESLMFDAPGSKEIGTTWMLGGPGLPTYEGWEAVQIFEPQEMKSANASFKIRCQ